MGWIIIIIIFYLSMLVVVAYELSQLLLSALQCCVQLLHLIRQVCFLHLQPLTVSFHSFKTQANTLRH